MQTAYDLNPTFLEKIIYDIWKSGHHKFSYAAINFNTDMGIYCD